MRSGPLRIGLAVVALLIAVFVAQEKFFYGITAESREELDRSHERSRRTAQPLR